MYGHIYDVSVGFWESKPEIIFFFWEAEILCYLRKIWERHHRKGSKRKQGVIAVLYIKKRNSYRVFATLDPVNKETSLRVTR